MVLFIICRNVTEKHGQSARLVFQRGGGGSGGGRVASCRSNTMAKWSLIRNGCVKCVIVGSSGLEIKARSRTPPRICFGSLLVRSVTSGFKESSVVMCRPPMLMGEVEPKEGWWLLKFPASRVGCSAA